MTIGSTSDCACPYCGKSNGVPIPVRRLREQGDVAEVQVTCGHCDQWIYYWLRLEIIVESEKGESPLVGPGGAVTRESLAAILDPFDGLYLECDGFTRVASYLLRQKGVAHVVMEGCVEAGPGRRVEPHLWIVVGNWTVDYRLRMWLGEEMPHGVFEAVGHPVAYIGEPVDLNCNKRVFEVLTGR